MSELWRLDALTQGRLRRDGTIAPEEAVEAAVARAEAVEPLVNAIAYPRHDPAVEQARSLPIEGGPFAGVPFAVKDWKCREAGDRWSWSNRALDALGLRAETSTELARRYREAGLISIGRTNLPELAFGPPTTEPDVHGPTRNPWSLDHGVGGSSGGSAAAVAAGIVPIANASDGGGSLRIPAACCGLIGLKVTAGRISTAPASPGRGIKVEGHVARSVADVAALLRVTAGPAAGEVGGPPPLTAAPPASSPTTACDVVLRIRPPGCMADGVGADAVPDDYRRAVEATGAALAELGHHVAEGDGPPGLDRELATPHLYLTERAVLRAEIERHLGRPLTADDCEPRTWTLFELATEVPGTVVLAELDAEQRWSAEVRRWWTAPRPRILVTPTLGRTIPRIGELKESTHDPLSAAIEGYPLAWFTYPFNVSGQPAISIPVGFDGGGLPIGVQLVAAWGNEELLLTLAYQLEQSAGFAVREPPPLA
ncbi:MAG: amidase [Actinomycetota bacterium]